MPAFTTVSVVPQPPEVVFAVITDTSFWPLFTGYGPMPGIVHAEAADSEPFHVGTVIEVTNTDGTHHQEVVTAFEAPRRYAIEMRLPASARRVLATVRERVDVEPYAGGSRITRRFEVVPRSWLTWPVAALIAHLLLRPAVERHNRTAARWQPPSSPAL